MSKSQDTFGKKEVQKRKAGKKKAKEARRQARKEREPQSLDDMIAYVDSEGNFTSKPPDPDQKNEVPLEEIEISVGNKSENEEEPTAKYRGRVTYFNEEKGFGFIKKSGSDDSIFVHIRQVVSGELTKDCKVSFDIQDSPKGASAVNVHVHS